MKGTKNVRHSVEREDTPNLGAFPLTTAVERNEWSYAPGAYLASLGDDISTISDEMDWSPPAALHSPTRAVRYSLAEIVQTPPAWMRDAACQQHPQVRFFPDARGDRCIDARRICAACPVRSDCLDYALQNGVEHGVWGGKTGNQRRKIQSATERRNGLIYAARFGSRLKVGFTTNPSQRVRHIRWLVGESDVELLETVPGTMADEYAIHAHLAPWRIGGSRGEWYSLAAVPAAVEWLNAHEQREAA